jgi:transcriptional regulator with XRE-family HTH domain
MTTAQLVREARRGSGLTQRELASRAGFTQPALADIERSAHDTRGGALSRLVGAAGYGLFVLPTTARCAAAWADLIYQELRSPRRSEEVAFRALIGLNDDLVSVSESLRVALCVAPPAPCGDLRFDAGVAGVVDYHLSKAQLPVPSWVREPSRVLKETWFVSPYTDLAEVPTAFRRHGVRLAESELASV